MKPTIAEQTRNAFDFIKKLHSEIAALIKDVENQLSKDDEEFCIIKPSGYGVTTRTSTGLEQSNVDKWLPQTITVFFCPLSSTYHARGQTITKFENLLQIIFLRIELIDKDLEEPIITTGVLRNITPKQNKMKKFENSIWVFAYESAKIFKKNSLKIDYSGRDVSFNGEYFVLKLFSINSSADVRMKIVDPLLKLYMD